MSQLLALLAALLSGGLLGAAATVVVSYRELRLKRLLESTSLFMTVTATAHGYRPATGQPVGLGEQVAAIHLVGVLARENPDLRTAGREFLSRYNHDAFGADSEAGVALTAAATEALQTLHRPPRRTALPPTAT